MKTEFPNAKAAKDFLASKVAAQAALENVPFTEDERKLMYYSVDDVSSQDSALDESGDSEFEEKISGLIQRAAKNDPERASYKIAFKKLSEGDHYLSVMNPFARTVHTEALQTERYQNPFFWATGRAPFVPALRSTPLRKSGPLFLTALAVAAGMMLVIVYWQPAKESFWHWLHHSR